LFGLGLDWRYISAIEAVFPVILLLSMIYIPESPYYLTKKGSSFLFQRLTQFRDNELVYRKKEISDISKSRWIIMKNLDFLFPGSKDLVFFFVFKTNWKALKASAQPMFKLSRQTCSNHVIAQGRQQTIEHLESNNCVKLLI
jgi:hypothetical protein